jgi:DegV family protein with EDD domain
MGRVAVVTDSVSCLPREVVERYGITIVPINVIIDGKVYRDGIDITAKEVYEILASGREQPTTSSPAPGDFLRAFRDLSEWATAAVCITISSDISMMYESAIKAREQAREEIPGLAISIVDSRTAGGAQGFVALEAARVAAQGGDLAQVTGTAEGMIPKVSMIAVLDTLYYLAKGGRIPRVAAWAGSMLQIKPILVFAQEKIGLLERARTKPKGVRRLCEIMADRTNGRPVHVMLMHANVPGEAQLLKERIEAQFQCVEIYVSDFAPTMGVQAGPGVLGLAFYADEDGYVE